MEIMIFKTNLSNAVDVHAISTCLHGHPGIDKWNVDMEDEDRILRIVSTGINSSQVQIMLLQLGFECSELL